MQAANLREVLVDLKVFDLRALRENIPEQCARTNPPSYFPA
jgi:hypothetical protein